MLIYHIGAAGSDTLIYIPGTNTFIIDLLCFIIQYINTISSTVEIMGRHYDSNLYYDCFVSLAVASCTRECSGGWQWSCLEAAPLLTWAIALMSTTRRVSRSSLPTPSCYSTLE